MKKTVSPQTYSDLVAELSSLIERGRRTAVRSVNVTLVATSWLVGQRIVEYEQQGKRKAVYGEELLVRLADDLSSRFGKGYSKSNLFAMRAFYLAYPTQMIFQTLSGKLTPASRKKVPPKSLIGLEWFDFLARRFVLSWSQYSILLRLDDPAQREFYERECIQGNWSVRQLDRQIQSLLYERVAHSKKKAVVIAKAHAHPIRMRPEDEIKDPYVLEFLGLKDEYSESQLEEALIRHLEEFLLELGIGFTFAARQKRITIDGTYFRLDLLLYHRVLKCLVAIDLKIGELAPADFGQMNFYLNYLKDREKFPDENDPIGLILCSDKKQTVVEYALGGISNQIFASKYKLQLPDPRLLQAEIEREKQKLLEMKIVADEK